jgi:hypothetical protein
MLSLWDTAITTLLQYTTVNAPSPGTYSKQDGYSDKYEVLESESSMKLILTCDTPLLVAVPTEGCKLPLEDY